jgi:hypothetical protein
MKALARPAPKYTFSDFVRFAAQKVGAPVEKTLQYSKEVFPYYRRYASSFADYVCELNGIYLKTLSDRAVRPVFSFYLNCEEEKKYAAMPGGFFKLWIFNNQTDQGWRAHPSKLPMGARNMIDRYVLNKSRYYGKEDRPLPHIGDSVWYFLFWVYLNYQASPMGMQLFSLIQPFWPELKETMGKYAIDDDTLEITEGRAKGGLYPVAAEFNEFIQYELENSRGGDKTWDDGSWMWDEEWIQDLDYLDLTDEEYHTKHLMTKRQGRYKLDTGWSAISDPTHIEIVGDTVSCHECGNTAGCVMYTSCCGDLQGEANPFIKCGFCGYQDFVKLAQELEYVDYWGHETIDDSCPLRILNKYFQRGLTNDLVLKVVAKKMTDETDIKDPREAYRIVRERFKDAPDLTRAFAIKILKGNACIQNTMFYQCKHISREKAMLWKGILNMEMQNSVERLGGMAQYRALRGV